jgi:putative oxidoreductase
VIHRLLATRPTALPTILRIAAGAIFFLFSFGKFFRHEEEARAFDRYGVPWPDVTVTVVGVLEFVGGVLLIVGLLTRPAALALAGNMIGAIGTGGRVDGGPIHLGLAPALLIVMLVLLRTGAGARSLDSRLSGAVTSIGG